MTGSCCRPLARLPIPFLLPPSHFNQIARATLDILQRLKGDGVVPRTSQTTLAHIFGFLFFALPISPLLDSFAFISLVALPDTFFTYLPALFYY